MQRPTTAITILAYIAASLVPAVEARSVHAEQTHAQAESDATQAAADKATAVAELEKAQLDAEKAHQEQERAEQEQVAAREEADRLARVKDELQTVQGLFGLVDKLPEEDRPTLLGIANRQLDGLMRDLEMSFEDVPPTQPAAVTTA